MHISKDQCRAARNYLYWSRGTLSRASGVSVDTIKNFEHGTFSPTHSTEQAIIAAFEAQGLEFVEGGVQKRRLCAACGRPPNAKADWLTVVQIKDVAAPPV
jgi:DNA-binding XRE family transcriptional regulator